MNRAETGFNRVIAGTVEQFDRVTPGTVEQSEMAFCLDALQNMIEIIEVKQARLHTRLSPVLVPQMSDRPAPPARTHRDVQSPLGKKLMELCNHLDRLDDETAQMLDYLTL